jgi:hypothetical protein
MSLGTFLDKEYFQSYKKNLFSLKVIPYLGTIIIGLFWNKEIFFILFSYLSSKHLIGQQLGLEKLINTEKVEVLRSKLSHYSYIIISSIIYYRIAFPQSDFWVWVEKLEIGVWLKFFIILLIYIVGFFDARVNFHKAKDNNLKILFWGNYFLIISAICFLQWGYIFFSFFVPRFIHDITAIFFYFCHDKNRNSDVNQNYIFQFLEKILKNPPYYVVPLIYFSFSNILIQMDSKIVEMTLFSLGIFHFYFESFMWKSGTIHRRYVALKG